jgi:hypothetical protein
MQVIGGVQELHVAQQLHNQVKPMAKQCQGTRTLTTNKDNFQANETVQGLVLAYAEK